MTNKKSLRFSSFFRPNRAEIALLQEKPGYSKLETNHHIDFFIKFGILYMGWSKDPGPSLRGSFSLFLWRES